MSLTTTRADRSASRTRSGAARSAASTQQASRARTAKERRVEALEQAVHRAVAKVYPGAVVVPAWGASLWRALADVTDAREQDLVCIARRLGYWPWSVAQILQAVGLKTGAIENVFLGQLCE